MKRQLITLLFAILALAAAQAQQISVVSTSGSTHLYNTLKEAIEGASSGSVIYLPGGGFNIGDSVKITKKVTIIGIGHKTRNENVDGSTIINGNLWYNTGSDGSAVMGCFINGDVNIGEDGAVNNVLVKLCNVNSVQVKNSLCSETTINQCYSRNSSNLGESNAIVKNNVLHSVGRVTGGFILSNIILNGFNNYSEFAHFEYSGIYANSTIIKYNIIPCKNESPGAYYYATIRGENNIIDTNMCRTDTGENPINIGDTPWEDLFQNYVGISSASNFHFKDEYTQYENQVGIYSGSGFKDSQLPPTPYIVGKIIPDNTDAAGKLNIRVRVKASSNE